MHFRTRLTTKKQTTLTKVKHIKQRSFNISITLPRPPEECRIESAFPQTHGKLDRSTGKAAQHKRNALKKSYPL